MKFILWQEIKEILLKNLKIFLMSVLAFTLLCVTIGICLDNYIYASGEQASMEESYSGKTFFKIIVDGENEVIQSFFSSENTESIKAFFDRMKNDPDFAYRYAHTNQVEFYNVEDDNFNESDFPAYTDACVTGYESGEVYGGSDYLSLKGVWVDHLFGTESTMSLSSGRWFTEEEFYADDAENLSFPVILGHEYEGLYELGDTLEYAHLGTVDNITLTVVGFLDEGSYFYDNNNDKIILDRYMMVPEPETGDSFPYLNEDGTYNEFFLSAYSTKIMNCRIICENEVAAQVQEKVSSIIREMGLSAIRISNETDGATQELADAEESTASTLAVCIFILVTCVVVYGIQMNYRIIRGRRKYGILLLNGITKPRIFLLMILDSLIVFLLSDGLYGIFWLLNRAAGETNGIVNGTAWIFPVVLLLQLLILVGIGFYGTLKITCAENLSMVLRENE